MAIEETVEENENRSIVLCTDIQILKTEEDRTGDDILAMSDFLGDYIQGLSKAIRTNAITEELPSVPFSDLGIIAEVFHQANVISEGTTQLLPDFDHLPNDIRQKLKDGTVKGGESKQVDGNLRAVIVNESGIRVKDVTLKEVRINPDIIGATRSIAIQLQMRQIYEKLDLLQAMQEFQIARDRDRDMKVPFLDARFNILKAQSQNCTPEERKSFLRTAADKLLSAVNSVYTEISTSSVQLNRMTRFPIFQNKSMIQTLINYLTDDLQIATKLVGLRLQIMDYLGDTDGSRIEVDRYKRVMSDFFTKPLSRKGYSAAELVHLHYHYTDENRDCWYKLATDFQPIFTALESSGCKHLYLVSVEDKNGSEQ